MHEPDAAMQATDGGGGETDSDAQIAALYLAQTHVLPPDSPLFKLVGNRPALLEVAVVSPSAADAPPVKVNIRAGGKTSTLSLSGPTELPRSFPVEPGSVVHGYDRTFTTLIPAEWVQPGLELEVTAGDVSERVTPAVGAPTVVKMTMFDVHYFGAGKGLDYPSGWEQELAAKWPVAELKVQRVAVPDFTQLVIPPRSGVGAARVSSQADYQAKTGLSFDGEQGAALAWVAALNRAGAQANLALCYVNIYGVNAGGQAGGFQGVGNGTAFGILHHELGHALSLPHWCGLQTYPYVGDMYGIPADAADAPHVGPTWGFDPTTGKFLPPTVQPGATKGTPGQYKRDPMCGGGTGDQEKPFQLRHFSDYSVNQMRDYLENRVVIYDAGQDRYLGWDDTTGSYSAVKTGNGVNFPLEHDAEVISVMASTSMADTDVNMIYPPIGPYRSGIIRTFDPSVAADRTDAAALYCPAKTGCDYSLRIVQGSVTRTLMLSAASVSTDPLQGGSLGTAAINLRAKDGTVTRVELLATPDAQVNGLPSTPRVLATWPPPAQP